MTETVITRFFGRSDYFPIWQRMKQFTHQRNAETPDEIWCLEHHAVFTQGQAGKPEHILRPGNIPIVQSDRGGQVTYHGPGQLVMYFLTDLHRKNLTTQDFIKIIEKSVIQMLESHGIIGIPGKILPGIYVENAKICSLGFRVRKGRTYHGLSLNVAMDLDPFSYINPCGHANLASTQTSKLKGPVSVAQASIELLNLIIHLMNYTKITQ